jgi:hypothetical protein
VYYIRNCFQSVTLVQTAFWQLCLYCISKHIGLGVYPALKRTHIGPGLSRHPYSCQRKRFFDQRWQLKTCECYSKRGGGERTDQSESDTCPPPPPVTYHWHGIRGLKLSPQSVIIVDLTLGERMVKSTRVLPPTDMAQPTYPSSSLFMVNILNIIIFNL